MLGKVGPLERNQSMDIPKAKKDEQLQLNAPAMCCLMMEAFYLYSIYILFILYLYSIYSFCFLHFFYHSDLEQVRD